MILSPPHICPKTLLLINSPVVFPGRLLFTITLFSRPLSKTLTVPCHSQYFLMYRGQCSFLQGKHWVKCISNLKDILLVLCTSRHCFCWSCYAFQAETFSRQKFRSAARISSCLYEVTPLFALTPTLSIPWKKDNLLLFWLEPVIVVFAQLLSISISVLAKPSPWSFHTLKIITTLRGVSARLPIPAKKQ